jgi:hypothetical protein
MKYKANQEGTSMAKNKGRGGDNRRNTMAALEDTDPMTREELLEAFGRSESDPEAAAIDRRDRQQSRPTDEQAMRG